MKIPGANKTIIVGGANVIKYQWHIAEEETTLDAPSPPYFKNETRFSYFKRTEFSIEKFKSLEKILKMKCFIAKM